MSTATRIARLEHQHCIHAVQSWRCSECGHGHGRNGPVQMRVIFEDDGTPEHCPACGRKLVFRLEFDDRG